MAGLILTLLATSGTLFAQPDGYDPQTQSGAFGVAVAGAAAPPVVTIASPADSATATAPVAVTGTVNDANLLQWQLMVSPAGQGQWTQIAGGSQNVNGALGTFDPTALANGQYDLGLFAVDANGRRSSPVGWVELVKPIALFMMPPDSALPKSSP